MAAGVEFQLPWRRADVDPAQVARFDSLFIGRGLLGLSGPLNPWWALCGSEWIRSMEDFATPLPASRLRFRQVAEHLLCRYPMPEFLFSVFDLDDHPQEGRMQGLFRHLAVGGSVREGMARAGLPVVFTRKACHLFMQGPTSLNVFKAIRWAQVRAAGGSLRLANAVTNTALASEVYDAEREREITKWISWFARHFRARDCRPGDITLSRLVDCFLDLGRDPTGRARSTVEREAARWERDEIPATAPVVFPACGIEGGVVFESARSTWSVGEILTMSDLRREGSAMRHCVSTYWREIEAGQMSLWSVRQDSVRRLTVSVRVRQIEEVRGKCNREPYAEEIRVVRLWARKAGLTWGF